MLCSIGHGEIPNLNFLFAPSCNYMGTFPLNSQLHKQQQIYCNFSPFVSNILVNPFPTCSQILVPKKEK